MEIDGNTSLEKLFPRKADIFKYIIENCYFFKRDIVIKDTLELISLFEDESKHLPVRYSAKLKLTKEQSDRKKLNSKRAILKYQKENNLYLTLEDGTRKLIKIDSDGNKSVRDKIKLITGQNISNGKKSDFQNFRISHIRAKTHDPILFSALFNVVIIPTWLDHFVDQKGIFIDNIETNNFFRALTYLIYFEEFGPAKSIESSVINYARAFLNHVKYIDHKS